jgi:hypothetical protein
MPDSPTDDDGTFAVLQRFLEAEGWPQIVSTAGRVIQTVFSAGATEYYGYLHWIPDARQLLFYSVYPRHAPKEAMERMQELVLRANWDLIWGNFELNPDHGGLRFKTSITLGEAALQPAMLRPLTLGNMTAMFRFQPAFDAVLESGASAQDALTRAI